MPSRSAPSNYSEPRPVDFYKKSSAAAMGLLQSDPDLGLAPDEARRRQSKFGSNRIKEAPRPPLWKKIFKQFNELVIWILWVAAGISVAVGDWMDAAAILAIVLLNGGLSFLQEERASRALQALRKMSSPKCRVIRGGMLHSLPASELVPGDRIELESGDSVPADARLLAAFHLRVQESSLTGESTPVEKCSDSVFEQDIPLGDRNNMVYMGTIVSTGRGEAVVTSIGMATELGKIAGMLEAQVAPVTPLQKRLTEVGRMLIVGCLFMVLIIFTIHLLRGGAWMDVFLTSVSLAVAAVPEGLPALVTVCLALGLQRMARRNVLVRRLHSVETLGCVTVICSDKTGTLTKNEMTVRELQVSSGLFQLSGSGYEPHGTFTSSSGPCSDLPFDLKTALAIGALCNHASVSPHSDAGHGWRMSGDPTEAALLVAAMKAKIPELVDPPKIESEIPFDSERQSMTVFFRSPSREGLMYTKGAPEVVLQMSTHRLAGERVVPLSAADKENLLEQSKGMAARALRVLGLAYRTGPLGFWDGCRPGSEKEMIFVGFAGMMDPPREEVKSAIQRCHRAGIRPVMITGDHPATATAIARELSLVEGEMKLLTGLELERMTDRELFDQVEATQVFARVSAEHKLRIVRSLQAHGHVVAMTGDGVNDAPAVKSADIGIAMGLSGSHVTKEVSDMVLTDDHFASIVNAVEEGRGIFSNIRKFLHYLLSSNASEVLFMFVAALVGWPLPLLPIHILWINLVSDSFPALALGMEGVERHVMSQKPRSKGSPILGRSDGFRIFFHGILIATVALVGFFLIYQEGSGVLSEAQITAFHTLAFAQIFYALCCRSHYRTFFELGIGSNIPFLIAVGAALLLQAGIAWVPGVRSVFHHGDPFEIDWILVFALALIPVSLIELEKLIFRKHSDASHKKQIRL